MILSLEGMFKWVHLRISTFRIVLNIDFDGTDRAYLRKVLQSHQISGLVIYLYQLKFGQLIESLKIQRHVPTYFACA